MKIKLLLLLPALLLCAACGQPTRHDATEATADTLSAAADVTIKYAKGFRVRTVGACRLVDISDPLGESEAVYRYALVPRGMRSDTLPAGYTVIEIPVRRVVCMTALQLSNFIKLDAVDRIVGMSSTRFLFNEQLKRRLDGGQAARIGIEGNFDSEAILAAAPDIILVSPFKKGGYDAIRNLDIPLVTFLGYKESSPLGQAEWIKFTAMLLGLETEAARRFDAIEARYNELKALAADASPRPTVLSGELHGGNWYVVGGQSYLAHLFADAGADYFMQNDNESGGFYVDFETVYSQGAGADFWRVLNSYEGVFTYDAMRQTDARYADFKAFKERRIIYCSLREKPFYEHTPVEPETVLADLIKAFHPDLLPDHKPVYYELLK